MMTLERPITAALNHLLSRQPSLRDKLSAHADKVVRVDVRMMQLNLAVGGDGLLQVASAEPNVTIQIQPGDLPLILSDINRAFSYVTINGDADFARTIAEVANGLQWDAEEDLAPFVGDIAAVRLVSAAKTLANTAKDGTKKLAENLAEYWLEENPTLMYRRDGDHFATDVARLRDDVERIGKRIEHIERSEHARSGAA